MAYSSDQEMYYRDMNAVLAPVRLFRAIKTLFMMIVLGIIALLTWVAQTSYHAAINTIDSLPEPVRRVLDIGPDSTADRQAFLDSARAMKVTTIDLNHREPVLVRGFVTDNAHSGAHAFQAEERELRRYEGMSSIDTPSFCDVKPGSLRTSRVADPEVRDWYYRKSNGFARALFTAQSNVSALRYSLTMIQLGQPVTDAHPGHVALDHSFCSMDPVNPEIKAGEFVSWIHAAGSIEISGIPLVRFQEVQYTATGPTSFTGMCMGEGCVDGLDTVPDPNDLTSAQPVLSDVQAATVQALYSTGDPDFWVEQAHANGITGKDQLVRRLAERQQRDTAAMYF